MVGLVRTGRFDVVVIDPLLIRADLYELILGSVHEVGAVILLLAPLTTLSATRALQSCELVPTELCFRGARNEDRAVHGALTFSEMISASAWLLHSLASTLRLLPPPCRTVAVGLFGGLEIPVSVKAFARMSDVSRRAVERHVSAAGIHGVKRLLDVVRVARAWDVLRTGPRSLREVSDRVGFSSVRTLTEHFHFFTGSSPRRSVRGVEGRDFAAQLLARLVAVDNGPRYTSAAFSWSRSAVDRPHVGDP